MYSTLFVFFCYIRIKPCRHMPLLLSDKCNYLSQNSYGHQTSGDHVVMVTGHPVTLSQNSYGHWTSGDHKSKQLWSPDIRWPLLKIVMVTGHPVTINRIHLWSLVILTKKNMAKMVNILVKIFFNESGKNFCIRKSISI